MVKCLLKNYFLKQGHSLILLLPYAWVTLDNSPNLQSLYSLATFCRDLTPAALSHT